MQYTQNSHHACQLFPLKKKKKNPDQSLPLSQNNVITDINVGLNHFVPCLLLVYFLPIVSLFLPACLEVQGLPSSLGFLRMPGVPSVFLPLVL